MTFMFIYSSSPLQLRDDIIPANLETYTKILVLMKYRNLNNHKNIAQVAFKVKSYKNRQPHHIEKQAEDMASGSKGKLINHHCSVSQDYDFLSEDYEVKHYAVEWRFYEDLDFVSERHCQKPIH